MFRLPSIFTGSSAKSARRPVGVIPARKPEPRDKGQPSLTKLPRDIIFRIIEFIQDVSPESVVNLASVSSHMYHQARYVQHRHVSINLEHANVSNFLDFIARNGLAPVIQALHVASRRRQPDQEPHPALSRLCDLIPNMTGLRDIHWKGSVIPEQILGGVKQLPRARLYMRIEDYDFQPSGRESPGTQLLASLAGSPNLFSVCADITYTSAEGCLEAMRPLKKLLLSCPNLRRLSLDVDQPRQGCVVYGPTAEYCGLGLSNGERPPPLEELVIRSYPWGQAKEGSAWSFNCLGYPGTGQEMDYWADTLDWSQLRRLHDVNFLLAPKIASKLTSLKHIKFNASWSANAERVTQFFDELPSVLESISIPNLTCVGADTILRHGTGLRRLEIHSKEFHQSKWNDHVPTKHDLVQFRDGLPHLEELIIDLDKDQANWLPHDTLDILAGFPKLRRLGLWFELGNASETPPEPLITAESACQLFRYLRGNATSQQPARIQRLHVHSGDPRGPGHGFYVSEIVHWPGENATSFVCEMAERDDEVARGLLRVTCPDLTPELNQQINRIIRGEEERSLPERNKVAFQVALNGPMPSEAWLTLYKEEEYVGFSLFRVWELGVLLLSFC
jgi:hypothetical protein